ncbi:MULTISPECIES: hypothetical protein [unclassified Burkholderia]|uniref:hypothetical protein n=1 Tax=unclassified Burkholderia TaxID=2613784 RepID=UPI000F5736A2|nr:MULTISPECIES: hypothetical protein [unclassified Burkholderia]RQR87466.1 hypothetical protein DIE10_05015 [Burkholderia sp. Bp9011]RQR96817.1 hypothetical protein DIE09_05200 [Burkholderia sp. Bp9010]RQS07509.1 hypothetical protein DIE02_13300 [Burkholderia sp. Bp8991]RQS30720.1 hypothetical protein DIE05_09360 [Burkholderia sp. Bp8995]RQS51513.1 hypothetical protein DIE00_01850 [Burkholderia sp. Bp8989]
MTAAASRIDVPQPPVVDAARRRRPGIVAVAGVIAVLLHGIGWYALQRMPAARGLVAARVDASSGRIALSVRLIPVTPEPAPATEVDRRTGPTAAMRGTREPKSRSGAAATPRRATRSLAAAPAQATTGGAPDSAESSPVRAPTPEVDWGRDLATIGTRRATGRSPAAATVGALGAAAGLPAARRHSVDETLASGVADARRADCRRAYSGAGLLALPMLALDAVRDTGCKW